MADIELIIKIPEEEYNIIKKSNAPMTWIEHLIANGTPLPKSRGRLIILSEDTLKREQTSLSFSCQNWISEVGLSNATVATIEADKEDK